MMADGTAIFYKVILVLDLLQKTPFWTSKLIFQNFDPSKALLLVPNSLFPPLITLPVL